MARSIYRTDGENLYIGKTTVEIRVKDAEWLRRQARQGEPMYSVVWKILDAYRAKDIDGYLEQFNQLHVAHSKTLELVDNLKQQLDSMSKEISNLKSSQGLLGYLDEHKRKRFMEIFDNLEAGQGGEVTHEMLVSSLTHPSNRMTNQEASDLIGEAMSQGKIYEKRNEVYAKA